MSSNAASFWRWSALALLIFLSACGGNGGGATVPAPVDPSSAYTGVRTQAVLDGNNVNSFAFGALGGVTFGSDLHVSGTLAKAVPAAQRQTIQQAALALKQSVRRMNVPGAAAKQRAKAAATQPQPHKVVRRSDSFTIAGPNGGSAYYSLTNDNAMSNFYGTVTYTQYSDGNTTISGTAQIAGLIDATGQELGSATISFRSLSVTIGQSTVNLVGTLSWAYNYYASSDALTMNMVLADNGKTYWFSNYQLTTTYGSNSITQTITGRYYDPLYGYVDLTTPTPLVVKTGDSWPFLGDLQASGAPAAGQPTAHTSVHLTFNSTTALVKADTNGDGTFDYQYTQQTNPTDGGTPSGGTSGNTPPVAVAGADRTVTQGATVSLDGRGSYDVNGDPLSYYWSFGSCPNNACPSLSNADTATPSFVADNQGLYTLQLTVFDGQSASTPATVSVTSTPAAPSDPGFKKLQWQYDTFGWNIGHAGLVVADLQGDGIQEIVASSGGYGGSYFYILRPAADGSYTQVWCSENYSTGMIRLALADLNGDGKKELVVGLADGTVLIYDSATRQLINSYHVHGAVTDYAIADLDGDGKPELIASDGIGVYVYSAANGQLDWSLSSGGGSSMAVGKVDGDGVQKIVTTSNGGQGYVIDTASHAVEWSYLNGFGSLVAIGDVDGDGKPEIVGAASWTKITVFDASRKTPLWEITTSEDIDSLVVTDTDGDGIAEIVYGDGQWGKIHAVDGRTRKDKWSVSNPEDGVAGLALADVDGDGQKELLWGGAGGSISGTHLYVAVPSTGTIKWQSQDFSGCSALAVGDVDGDGKDEIVMVSQSSNGGYGSGIILVFDAVTHALKAQQALPSNDWSRSRVVRIGDVDGDGKPEIVVTTANIYDGIITVYDGATLAIKAQSARYSDSTFTALTIADVDGDGKKEIVTSSGGDIIVFDGVTLQEKWRSVQMGAIYDIKVGDVDGDGHAEIVASVSSPGASSYARLMVYDGVTHNLKLLIQEPARALDLADVDGDGVLDIVVGRDDGKIDVLDGKAFANKKTVPTFSTSPVDALQLVDLDGDGVLEWCAVSGSAITILDGKAQGLKWRSAVLGSGLGVGNHLSVKDTEGDGSKELFVGSASAIYQFQ